MTHNIKYLNKLINFVKRLKHIIMLCIRVKNLKNTLNKKHVLI